METIFDKDVRGQLIDRIGQINEFQKPEWGKMNLIQMLKHNTYWNRWILGKDNHSYKQVFLGKLFGKIALKRMIKNGKPFDKNIPTSDQFKVKESTGDIESEKADWILLINEYETFSHPEFIHDFFGKMTNEHIGILVYKHTDHHLRQFGV
ncbi:hypothetical protein [Sphingobacterium haloxyli]|uniref:DUF1569 domain-containing protein n=1 Tax=Sphingobacterium haloxyli TaxID=2100533 RepID=A0A2S9J4E2_9SPHI|nr:hypothetical protein [Sphingobacterium haloxyli]PRD47599.1 hypothetical protein C5745_09820 [Sphingobacterium haloxyli]